MAFQNDGVFPPDASNRHDLGIFDHGALDEIDRLVSRNHD